MRMRVMGDGLCNSVVRLHSRLEGFSCSFGFLLQIGFRAAKRSLRAYDGSGTDVCEVISDLVSDDHNIGHHSHLVIEPLIHLR